MTVLSYHVSHEQFAPADLLAFATHAENAGFQAAFSSDHIQPWGAAQGHSGFLWAWLGAALQATRRLRFSGITVPGGWRYHPVVTAHALATLGQMYPGRLPWMALGSGEAINERMIGTGWPGKDERDARLAEAAGIVRRLLRGETVDHAGLLRAEGARIWTLPPEPPLLVGAAMSEPGARRVAAWADGLLTTCTDLGSLRGIIDAYRDAGGRGGIHLKVELCWAQRESDAVAEAREQWHFPLAGREASQEMATPAAMDAATGDASADAVCGKVLVSSSLARHADWLAERLALGLETLDLHQVGKDQRGFIDAFGSKVLPALRQRPFMGVLAGLAP